GPVQRAVGVGRRRGGPARPGAWGTALSAPLEPGRPGTTASGCRFARLGRPVPRRAARAGGRHLEATAFPLLYRPDDGRGNRLHPEEPGWHGEKERVWFPLPLVPDHRYGHEGGEPE